jgi:hypothetical protein
MQPLNDLPSVRTRAHAPSASDGTPMADFILIPFPGLGTLAMSKEQFDAALAAGSSLSPTQHTSRRATATEELVDAQSLERRTGVPASWWMAQARKGCIPFRKMGRRVRFDPHEVMNSPAFITKNASSGPR